MSDPEEVQALIKLLEPRLADDQTDLYRRALEQFDRVILRRTLERCEGNLTRAAGMLGLSRVTLRSKLRALGLTAGKGNAAEPSETDPTQTPTNHTSTGHTAGHLPIEHSPHTHPSIPRPSGPPIETGQDLTRTDRPGSGFSEPHMSEAVRRETGSFRKP
jgi:DNA-binding protein Fis